MIAKALPRLMLALLLVSTSVSALGLPPTDVKALQTRLGPSASVNDAIVFQNQTLSHTFDLDVVFVGYDEEVVDAAAIDSEIQDYYELYYSDAVLSYQFNLQYHFADTLYYQSLRSFILQNAMENTWTSKLNETALEIQKNTGTRMPIFLEQSGTAIDAFAVEDWFTNNPFVQSSAPGYTFYVLNFTDFDSPDHSSEHWYNITEYDLEANSIRDYWRLEWDNALNPNVRFPYPAFSSDQRLFFLDPSAFQWYLTWARMWFGLSETGPKYLYYYQDLDEFLATHDVTQEIGKLALAQYLAGWIDDILYNDLSPKFMMPSGPPVFNSLSLQVLVLNNVSEYGYTNEEMAWILDPSLVENSVLNLLPYLDFSVSVEFANLVDYPMLKWILDSCIVSQENGWIYIDGVYLFFYLYFVREAFFDFTAAELVVNCFVFLVKDASMLVGGMEATGLGGGGQSLILKSVDRYFRPDGSRKSGLGYVMIHELGHNLGLLHNFMPNKFAGDFIEDPMGYYPYAYSFSTIKTDVMRRTIVDKKLLDLLDMLVQDEYLYTQVPQSAVIDTLFTRMNAKINHILQQYDEMSYLDAYYTVVEAEELQEQLRSVITQPRIPATIDIEPDTLNPKSTGEWITCLIELPETSSVTDIEPDLIFLNETVPVDTNAPTEIGDQDQDGTLDLTVKFSRENVFSWLESVGYAKDSEKYTEVTFKISGKVNNAIFEGYTQVRVPIKE